MGDYVLDDGHEEQVDEFGDENNKEDNSELEAIKERFKEIEADTNKLHDFKRNNDKSPLSKSNTSLSEDDKMEVDYGSTADELEAHFRACGPINRVTILCNKYTGHPKGFAYIEFDTRDAVDAAMALDDSAFRNRQLKILPKRTNVPGMSMTNRVPIMRGRARGRMIQYGGFRPTYAGRIRFPRYRRRGVYYFSPY